MLYRSNIALGFLEEAAFRRFFPARFQCLGGNHFVTIIVTVTRSPPVRSYETDHLFFRRSNSYPFHFKMLYYIITAGKLSGRAGEWTANKGDCHLVALPLSVFYSLVRRQGRVVFSAKISTLPLTGEVLRKLLNPIINHGTIFQNDGRWAYYGAKSVGYIETRRIRSKTNF